MQDLAERLKKRAYEELTQYILPWWQQNMLDTKHGGFYGEVNGQGKIVTETPKSALLHANLLWTFSAAALQLPDVTALYIDTAHEAYHYFTHHFLDEKQGGSFTKIDIAGKPVHEEKLTSIQAQAIIGLVQYYRITNNETVLHQCIELFEYIECNSLDTDNGGYWDFCRVDGKTQSIKDISTHLLVLEAYKTLLHSWKSPKLLGSIETLLHFFLNRFIDYQQLHFNLSPKSIGQETVKKVCYGKDLEASWILYNTSLILPEGKLKESIQSTTVQIGQHVLSVCMDRDGGVFHEKSIDQLDTDKYGWSQTEAMICSTLLWQLTNEWLYLEYALRAWAFVQSKLINNANDTWHRRTNQQGEVYFGDHLNNGDNMLFHQVRACLMLIGSL